VIISSFGNAWMKRLFNICVVLSVIVGSCSNLLAVVLCPHVECRPFDKELKSSHTSVIKPQSEGHSCSTSLNRSEEHSHTAAQSSEHETKGHALSRDTSSNHSSSCAHCIGTTIPTSIISEQELSITRRDVGVENDCVIKQISFSLLSHVPEVIPSQGSPPGSSRPRHLLINIFRI
jgi:hypothetical protein